MAAQSRSGGANRSGRRPGQQEEPGFTRPALAPGLLAAIALLIGAALVDNEWFTLVRYVVSILALIIAWFAIQARAFWWLVPLVAAAVLWNPVLPLPLSGPGWLSAQLIAPVVFVVAGVMIRVPVKDRDGSGRA